MDDVQSMVTWMLVENYRSTVGGAAKALDPKEKARLSKEADRYEEEILRRMAW